MEREEGGERGRAHLCFRLEGEQTLDQSPFLRTPNTTILYVHVDMRNSRGEVRQCCRIYGHWIPKWD